MVHQGVFASNSIPIEEIEPGPVRFFSATVDLLPASRTLRTADPVLPLSIVIPAYEKTLAHEIVHQWAIDDNTGDLMSSATTGGGANASRIPLPSSCRLWQIRTDMDGPLIDLPAALRNRMAECRP